VSASAAALAAAVDAVAAAPNGKAGPVALFVIVLLGVCSWFLFRSMSRHLRRIPDDFAPPNAAGAEPTPPEQPGGAG